MFKRENAKEVLQCLLGLYKRTEMRDFRCIFINSLGRCLQSRYLVMVSSAFRTKVSAMVLVIFKNLSLFKKCFQSLV